MEKKNASSGHLEGDDNNAINLDLNADAVFPVQVHLKQWKDPDKLDARHIRVKEKLESAKCYLIKFSGKLCSDTDDEQCTAEKSLSNDLLGTEPTTEPPVPSTGD